MTNIKFDKKTIIDAVVNAASACADRSPIPALEGVKLKLNKNNLEIVGYNLEIGIQTNAEVQSEDTAEFVINARLFAEMLKKMPGEEITLTVTDNLQVNISSLQTQYNLPAMASDEYPNLPEIEKKDAVIIPQPILKSMISQTIFAVSTSDDKPILKGELFEIENGIINVIAIDGYRLAIRTENIGYQGNKKFVIPEKTLNHITKLLSENDDETCNIYLNEKHAVFEIGKYMVYSRLLEGEFIAYKNAIPQNNEIEVTAQRTELVNSLERASLLILDRTNNPIRCSFKDNDINIKCSTALGKISDHISCSMNSSEIEIGFKCKFMLDPLKAVHDEEIKILLTNNLKPMVIVPTNNNNYKFLVLPVRLKSE